MTTTAAKPWVVRLDWTELRIANLVATEREIQNLGEERPNRHGIDAAREWEAHFTGAMGEIAVAKLTGTFWSGALGDLGAADVGPLQVRTTLYPKGKLILHPADDDNARWILVRVAPPWARAVGWCFGREGKLTEHWSDPTGKNRPAFFVPDRALRPMEELWA